MDSGLNHPFPSGSQADRPLSLDRERDAGAGPRVGRVLMVAAAFPPTGGPGVQRVGKFAKYLPRLGWRPYVWSLDRMPEFPIDESLLDDLPSEVRILRRKADGWVRAADALRAWGRSGRFGHSVGRWLDWRLRRRLSLDRHPDALGTWARQSVRPLIRFVSEARIDAIFSSFSPASNHLLGMTLSQRTGLPWIADFRDLWTDDYRYGDPPPARRARDRALELAFLERADRVIGVTEAQTRMLADRVPSQREKFLTITNGFDRDDFRRRGGAPAGATVRRMQFVLGYVGRLEARRVPEALIAGLCRFGARLGSRRGLFLFRVVGHAGAATQRRLRQSGIACEFEAYQPHKAAIRSMYGSDALLVLVPEARHSETTIPGKPYEYMATGRPVLHIGPADGACATMIRACRAGETATFEAESICRALMTLFDAWSSGAAHPGCPQSQLARFDRHRLTRALAGVLNEVSGIRPVAVQEARYGDAFGDTYGEGRDAGSGGVVDLTSAMSGDR